MTFPGYEDVEEPLLCFIYFNGGDDHEVNSGDAYKPLADYFGLSVSDRARPRPDGRDEPLWNNMVQWARRKLKDRGYLAASVHGRWRLSDAGVFAAQKLATKYARLKR